MSETWLISRDELDWSMAREYPSRKEALADLPKVFAEFGIDTLWIGRKENYIPDVEGFGERIIEQLYCEAQDIAGEHAEEWPAVETEALLELDSELAAVIEKWIEKHCKPGFYLIEEATKHHARGKDTKKKKGKQ